ncbi:MAG: hypothetical protein ACJ8FU_15455 [Xanthobacteraceae bacterium]|jgi:hypothetical protein
MSSPEFYRRKAAQCILVAEETTDAANRLVLMEMAQAWVRLAEQAEKNLLTDVVYETPPQKAQLSE